MDARGVEVPAYWRVEGQDFVAYPNWNDPMAYPAPPALTVETADAYLQKYTAHGFGCGVAPVDARTLINEMGDALQAKYGPEPAPIMYIGCSNAVGPVLFGDLQSAGTGGGSADHLLFKRGDHLEIVASAS